MAEPSVTVELFGLARHRAGRADLRASGRTVADVLRAIVRTCPGLTGLIAADGSLSRQYVVSLNGEQFIDDPAEPVPKGCKVLILGADAGG